MYKRGNNSVDRKSLEICMNLLSELIVLNNKRNTLYQLLRTNGFEDADLIWVAQFQKYEFQKKQLPLLKKLFTPVPKRVSSYKEILNTEGFGIKELIPFFLRQDRQFIIEIIYNLCELSQKDTNGKRLSYWCLLMEYGLSLHDLLRILNNAPTRLNFFLAPHKTTYTNLPPLDLFRQIKFKKEYITEAINSTLISVKALTNLVELISLIKHHQCDISDCFVPIFELAKDHSHLQPFVYCVFQSIYNQEELSNYFIDNNLLGIFFKQLIDTPSCFYPSKLTLENFKKFFPLKTSPEITSLPPKSPSGTEQLLQALHMAGFTRQELEPLFLKDDTKRLNVLKCLVRIQKDKNKNILFFQNNQPATYLILLGFYGFTHQDILSILNQEKGDETLRKCLELVAFIYFEKLLLQTEWRQAVVELANSPDRANHLYLFGRILAQHAEKIDKEKLIEWVCSSIASKTAEECKAIPPQMFKLFLYPDHSMIDFKNVELLMQNKL